MMKHRARSAALIVAMAAAASAAAAQERPAPRSPDTDQTVTVARDARLTIENFAGEVVIRTWDRDAVRVLARHSSRVKVSIRNSPSVVSVSSGGGHGPASVDYEITAPASMPVTIDGVYNFVNIEGAQAEVSATTVRGDIHVKGGTGFVTAKSIEGQVIVDGARGRISAESVNEGVRITGSSGDIVATTTNGDITMMNVEAKSVEADTVNGDITLEGGLAGGRFRFTTHNGDITLSVPETASATFNVRTYNGSFRTNLPLKGDAPADAQRGRRVTFTLGSGATEVNIETFQGSVRIQRPGTSGQRGGKDKAKAKDEDVTPAA